MRIYLVGGAVRDELMGRDRHDRDYTVIGTDENSFMQLFPSAKKIGNRQNVYLYKGDEYTLSHFDSIEADLLSRDLTVNAFAKDAEGRIFGHPRAFEDLRHKRLYPVAEKNFFSDPLRVLRAARFTAQFPEFQPDPSLLRVMGNVARQGLLGHIAAERVGNEVRKMCDSPRPSRFFEILRETFALSPWFDEIAQAVDVPAGPHPFHEGSVFEHLLEVADLLQGEPLAVWMAICHDLGKTVTPKEKWPTHHRHELLGEVVARNLGARLRLPLRFIHAGAAASRWHMMAGRYDTAREGTKVNLLLKLHRMKLVHEMFLLAQADNGTDFSSQVKRDLRALLAVHLPRQYMGLGPKSGEALHRLRCQELAKISREMMETEGSNEGDSPRGGF
ncbi:MAG: HD domain-containing protein [Thermodesulfobacteriota bacterium]